MISEPVITLREAGKTESDADRAMRWRNDPQTLAMSFHREPKRWETFWTEYRNNYFTHAALPPQFAQRGSECIAFLKFSPYPPEADVPGPAVDIGIVVAPEWRGKGLSAPVLRAATEDLRRRGYSTVVAEIKQNHDASIRAFSRAGYRRLDARDKRIEDTGEVVPIFRYVADSHWSSSREATDGSWLGIRDWVLFDLDGTLADSLSTLRSIYREFLEKYGIAGTAEEFDRLQGSLEENIAQLKRTHSLPQPLDELCQNYYNALCRAFESRIPTFPEASALMDALFRRGIGMGLVTSGRRKLASLFLKQHGWEKYFQFIVCGDDVERGKPSPDLYLRACQVHTLNTARTFAVEDSRSGYQSAIRAGLHCVRVDHVRTRLSDLLRLIERGPEYDVLPQFEVIASPPLSLIVRKPQRPEKEPEDPRVEDIWKAETSRNPSLFNGRVLIYEGRHSEGDSTVLEGQFVSYKHFLAHLRSKELAPSLEALGVSGLTLVTDGDERAILIAQRTESVTQYPGCWELVPAGTIDPGSSRPDGTLDFKTKLIEELREESNIGPDRLQRIEDLALVYDLRHRIYDLCCLLEVKAVYEDVLEQFPAGEYRKPILVPTSQVRRFLKLNSPAMVASSVAMLELALDKGLL